MVDLRYSSKVAMAARLRGAHVRTRRLDQIRIQMACARVWVLGLAQAGREGEGRGWERREKAWAYLLVDARCRRRARRRTGQQALGVGGSRGGESAPRDRKGGTGAGEKRGRKVRGEERGEVFIDHRMTEVWCYFFSFSQNKSFIVFSFSLNQT